MSAPARAAARAGGAALLLSQRPARGCSSARRPRARTRWATPPSTTTTGCALPRPHRRPRGRGRRRDPHPAAQAAHRPRRRRHALRGRARRLRATQQCASLAAAVTAHRRRAPASPAGRPPPVQPSGPARSGCRPAGWSAGSPRPPTSRGPPPSTSTTVGRRRDRLARADRRRQRRVPARLPGAGHQHQRRAAALSQRPALLAARPAQRHASPSPPVPALHVRGRRASRPGPAPLSAAERPHRDVRRARRPPAPHPRDRPARRAAGHGAGRRARLPARPRQDDHGGVPGRQARPATGTSSPSARRSPSPTPPACW